MASLISAQIVRQYYKNRGYEVHISREGHVTYRPADHQKNGVGCEWLEGRYVSEYIVIDGNIHLS
jgi:hypothetical protein